MALAAVIFVMCTDNVDPRFEGVEYDPTPYNIEIPERFPVVEVPEDNPLTVEGVALGRRLFYEPMLHIDNDQSCATCHQQQHAFSSEGPVLPHINLGWNQAFLWDGKVQGTLEDIMLFEVREFFQADMARFNAHDEYPVLFYQAFGKTVITEELAAMALAQFERTMISSNSVYDRAMRGEIFFTDAQYNGMEIFFTEKGDCFHCHGGILFTDNLFHNNALDADPEPGYGAITGSPEDLGKFKTPTLRNIELTAPYMHDGRYVTLEEVVDFYSEGLNESETVDPLMKQIHKGGIQLTDREKGDLVEFLKCLTDTTFTSDHTLSNPF
jgi:cytochrome c peroxidase